MGSHSLHDVKEILEWQVLMDKIEGNGKGTQNRSVMSRLCQPLDHQQHPGPNETQSTEQPRTACFCHIRVLNRTLEKYNV